MKIKRGAYPEEKNWQEWIRFKYKDGARISLVFLWRLAALARDYNHTMTNLFGYRSSSSQQALYEADLKANGGKPTGKVAAPGLSWHEYGLAVDLDGAHWKAVSEAQWMPYTRLKQNLTKYGLILPLNRVDSPSVQEWWHLQPIETNGVAASLRKTFLDPDDILYEEEKNMTVKEFQAVHGLSADGVVGEKTAAKALEELQVVKEILASHPKTVIQSHCGFSDPDGIWEVIRTHKYPDALLKQWADSYFK